MPAAQVALALGKQFLKEKAISKGIEKYNNSSPETKVLIIALPVFILVLPLIAVLMMMLLVTSITSSYHSDVDKLGGAPTSYGSNITGEYLVVFQQAQTRYNVSWAVLAAIAETESSMGKYPIGIVSNAGAVGFMQFMPATWSGHTNPKAEKNKNIIITALKPYDAENLPPPNTGGLPYDTDPNNIALYGGYGTDGDGDGYADPITG